MSLAEQVERARNAPPIPASGDELEIAEYFIKHGPGPLVFWHILMKSDDEGPEDEPPWPYAAASHPLFAVGEGVETPQGRGHVRNVGRCLVGNVYRVVWFDGGFEDPDYYWGDYDEAALSKIG